MQCLMHRGPHLSAYLHNQFAKSALISPEIKTETELREAKKVPEESTAKKLKKRSSKAGRGLVSHVFLIDILIAYCNKIVTQILTIE